jgi:sulfopyruvate decarboxylase TPP-binding subunit
LWVIPSKTLQSELWQETIDEYVKFGKLAPNIWRDWAIDAYRVVNNENYKTLLETAWESDTKFFDAVKTVMVNNWLSDVANDKVVWVFSKLTKVLCV